MAEYTRFIGIDWSGAKTPWLRGLQVAQAEAGRTSVTLIRNPYAAGKPWRRQDVVRWLRAQLQAGEPLLIGIDAAFALPHGDVGDYFPHTHGHDIHTPHALWAHIESLCQADGSFYGGGAATAAASWLKPYLLTTIGGRGAHFSMRWRRTESLARHLYKASPSTVCKGIGPDGVAMGSLAAMRVAAHLHDALAIWPFLPAKGSTLLEIFPRLYYQRAGEKGGAWRDAAAWQRVLAYYNAEAPTPTTEDEADALVSAAALRVLAKDARQWQDIDTAAAKVEGWIFGVRRSAH